MAIVQGFIMPIIKLVFIGGFFGLIGFFVVKALWNAYSKSYKFVWKHKIMRKPYNEDIVLWCMDCVDQGIGWYDAKKLLMVKNYPKKQINETLWIYDQMIIELQGGIDKNGKRFKGTRREVETTKGELPIL